MKRLFLSDLPPRAAAVVVALVLAASVVTGGEKQPAPEPLRPAPARSADPKADLELDLEPLKRKAREGEVQDLFAPPVPAVAAAPAPAPSPPPVAKAAPPPTPTAPQLPFRFLGFVVQEGKATVYLERAGATLDARAGDALAPDYRLESISDTEVTFVYLPLSQKQSLQVPPP